jgi:hypothetical protein
VSAGEVRQGPGEEGQGAHETPPECAGWQLFDTIPTVSWLFDYFSIKKLKISEGPHFSIETVRSR